MYTCPPSYLPVRSQWYTLAAVVVWVCYVRDYTRVLIATALGVIRGRKFRQTEIPVPINLGDVDEWGVLFSFFFFFFFLAAPSSARFENGCSSLLS